MSNPIKNVAVPASVPAVAVPPTRGNGHGRRPPARRPSRTVVAVLAAVVAAAALCGLPAVRKQLRESFTRMPDGYEELYFTSTPTVSGDTALVPITLRDHGTATTTYRVRAWLRSGTGPVTAVDTASITPRPDAGAVLRLRPFHGPATVYVELLGHTQTLHFRLTGPPDPDTKGTS